MNNNRLIYRDAKPANSERANLFDRLANEARAKTAAFRQRPDVSKRPRNVEWVDKVINQTNKDLYGDVAQYIKPVSRSLAIKDRLDFKKRYNDYWDLVRYRNKVDQEENAEIEKERQSLFGNGYASKVSRVLPIDLANLSYTVKNIVNDIAANKASGGAEALESDNRDLLTKSDLKDDVINYLKIKLQFDLVKEALPQTTGDKRRELESELYSYKQYLEDPNNILKMSDYANARNREHGFWRLFGDALRDAPGTMLEHALGYTGKAREEIYGSPELALKVRDKSLVDDTVKALISKGRDSLKGEVGDAAYLADDYSLAIAGIETEDKSDKNEIKENNARANLLRLDEARIRQNIPRVWTEKSLITQDLSLFNPDYWKYCVPGTVGSSISSDNFWKAMAIKGGTAALGAAIGAVTGGWKGAALGAVSGWNAGSVFASPWDVASGFDENKVEIHDKYLDNLLKNLDARTASDNADGKVSPLKTATLSLLLKLSLEYWRKRGMSDDYINNHYDISNDEGVRNVLNDLASGRTSITSPLVKECAMDAALGLNAQYYSDNVVTMSDTFVGLGVNWLPGGNSFKLGKTIIKGTGKVTGITAAGKAIAKSKFVKSAGNIAKKAKDYIGVERGNSMIMFDNAASRVASTGAAIDATEAAAGGMANSFKAGYNAVGGAAEELGFGLAGKAAAGTVAGTGNVLVRAAKSALPQKYQQFIDDFGRAAVNKYQGVLDKLAPVGSWRRLAAKYGYQYAKRRAIGAFSEATEEGNQYQFSQKDFSKYRYGLPSLTDLFIGHTEATMNAVKSYASLFGICDSELKDDMEYWNNVKGGAALGMANVEAAIQSGLYTKEAYQLHAVNKALQLELAKNREDENMTRRSNQAVSQQMAKGRGDAVINYLEEQKANDQRRSKDQRMASDKQWDNKILTAREIQALTENKQLTRRLEAKGIKYGSAQYNAAIADYYNSRQQIRLNQEDINDINQRVQQRGTTKNNLDAVRSYVELEVDQQIKQSGQKVSDEERATIVENRVKERAAINVLYNQLLSLLELKSKVNTVKGFFRTLKRNKLNNIQSHSIALKHLNDQISQVKSLINELHNLRAGIQNEDERFDVFEGRSESEIYDDINNSNGFMRDGYVQDLSQQKALLEFDNQLHLMHIDQMNYGIVERERDTKGLINKAKNLVLDVRYEYNPEEYERQHKDRVERSKRAKEYSDKEKEINAKIETSQKQIKDLKEQNNKNFKESKLAVAEEDQNITKRISDLESEIKKNQDELNNLRSEAKKQNDELNNRERLASSKRKEDDRYVQRINRILDVQKEDDALNWMVQDIAEGNAGQKIDELLAEEYFKLLKQEDQEDQATAADYIRYLNGISEFESKEEQESAKREYEEAKKKREEKLKQNGLKWNNRRQRVLRWAADKLSKAKNKYKGTTYSALGVTPEFLENFATRMMSGGIIGVYKIGNFIDDLRATLQFAAKTKGLSDKDVDNEIKENNSAIVRAYKRVSTRVSMALALTGANVKDLFSTDDELALHLILIPTERLNLKQNSNWTSALLAVKQKFDASQALISRDDFYTTYVNENGKEVAYRNVIWSAFGKKEDQDSASLKNAKAIRSGILNYIITGDISYILNIVLSYDNDIELSIKDTPGYDKLVAFATNLYNNIQSNGLMPLDVNLNIYGKAKDGSNISSLADIVLIDRNGNAIIYNVLTSIYSNIMNTGQTSQDLGTIKTLVSRAISEMKPVIEIFQNKYGLNVSWASIIPIQVDPGVSINVESDVNGVGVSLNNIEEHYNVDRQRINGMLNLAIQKYNDYARYLGVDQRVGIDPSSMPVLQVLDMIDSINNSTELLIRIANTNTKKSLETLLTEKRTAPIQDNTTYTEKELAFIEAVTVLDGMISNMQQQEGLVDDNFILQTLACQTSLYQLLKSKESSIDNLNPYSEVVVKALEYLAKNSTNYSGCRKAINNFVSMSIANDTMTTSLDSANNMEVMLKTANLWNNIFGLILSSLDLSNDTKIQQWYSELANNFLKPLLDNAKLDLQNRKNIDPVSYNIFNKVFGQTQNLIDQYNQRYKVATSLLIDTNDISVLNSMSTRTINPYTRATSTSCLPSLSSMRQSNFRSMVTQKDFTANAKISFKFDNRNNPLMIIKYNGNTVILNFAEPISKNGSTKNMENYRAYAAPFVRKLTLLMLKCQADPTLHISTKLKKRRVTFNYDNGKNGRKYEQHNVSQFLFSSEENGHNMFTIKVSSEDKIGTLKDRSGNLIICDQKGLSIGNFVDPDTGNGKYNPPVGQLIYMYNDGRNEQHGKYTPIVLSVLSFGQLGMTLPLMELIRQRANGNMQTEDGYDIDDLISLVMFTQDPSSRYQVTNNAIAFGDPGIVTIGRVNYNVNDTNDYQKLTEAINNLRVCENIELLNQNLTLSDNDALQKVSSIFKNTDEKEVRLPNGLVFTRDDFMHQENGIITGSTYLGYMMRNNIIGTNATNVDDTYIEIESISLERNDDGIGDASNTIKESNSKSATAAKVQSGLNGLMSGIFKSQKHKPGNGLNEIIDQSQIVGRTDEEIEDYKRRASDVIRQMLGDGSVKTMQFKSREELNGENQTSVIAGICHSSFIELGTFAPESTVYHEAFHKILELTMPSAKRDKLYQVYRNKYKNQNLSERDVAEGLADMFTSYVQHNILDKNLKGFKYFYGWCKRVWFNMMMSIKFGNQWKNFKALYAQMLRGDYNGKDSYSENVERFKNQFGDSLYYELEDKLSGESVKFEHIANISEAREVAKSLAYLVIKANGLDSLNPSGTKLKLNQSTPNKFNLIKSGLVSLLRADGVDVSQKTDAQRIYSEVLEQKIENVEETDKKGNVIKRQITTYPKFAALIPLINQYISSISTGFNGRLQDIEDETDSDVDLAVKDNIDKFDKASYEFNPLDQVVDRVKVFFGTLPRVKYDSSSKTYKYETINRLGTPEFYDVSQVFTTLTSEVNDLSSIEDLTKKLESMKDRDGLHRQVYHKWKALCDYLDKNPNDNDARQLQISVAKSLKCHVNNYVFCYSQRDLEGNLISQVKNTEYDRDTVFAPKHWLDNLYNGNTGIFSTIRDSNGNPAVSADVDILKNVSNMFELLRSELSRATSATSDSSIINLNGVQIDLDDPASFNYLKGFVVQLLNSVGIPINNEQLDYILNNRFDSSDARGLSLFMNGNSTDSMTPFINILGSLVNNDGTLNNKYASDGYTNCGFIKELANWMGQYNRSRQTSSRLGFDSKRYYQVSLNFAISLITDMINSQDESNDIYNALLNSKYMMLVGPSGAVMGSIFAKAINSKRKFKLRLLTDIGSKTDRSDDIGNTYTNRTELDDFIAKYTALREGYVLFPTLADKSGFVYIDINNYGNSEISIPGLSFDTQYDEHGHRLLSVKSAPKIGYNPTIGNYFIPDNRVLDLMIEYAELEKARILEIMQECGYEDRDKIDGYEDNPNVKFIPKEYRVKNIHTGKGIRFQSLRDLVLEDGVTTVNLSDENKTPAELMNLANKNFFNKTQELKRQIMTMILARANKNIVNKALSLGIITVGNDTNGATKLTNMTRNVFDNLRNVALDNEEVRALANYLFKNNAVFANEKDNDKITAKRNLCTSLAIAALLGDAQNRHIIGTLETQRWYVGNPSSFKNDADIQKRMGSLMSTGEDNIMYYGAPKYYNCAEVADYVVGLSEDDHNKFHNLFLNGELKETLANALISKLKDGEDNLSKIRYIYDMVYSPDMTVDKIEAEFNKLGPEAIEQMNKAKKRASDFTRSYDENNVADGLSYMSDRMCEQLLKFNGAWVGDVPRAFELIRKDNLTEKEYYEAYRLIQKAVNIVTVKYTAYGTRIHPITGEPITYLNKFAIAPIFKNIATGKMKDICQYMTDHNIDNLLFDSAVKIGSCNPILFNGVSFDNDLTIYQQPYANLRKQMNTDPEEGDEMHIGTQMVKVVLSNLILNRLYKNKSGELIEGKLILSDMMNCIDKLRDFGEQEFLDQFFTNGSVDESKTSNWLTDQMGSRNATEQLVSALSLKPGEDGKLHQNMPIAATASSKWVESIIISNVNKKIVDIMTPGTSFVQRSVFAMEDENRKEGEGEIKGADSYNGQELKMINNKNSMDAIVSLDYFKDIIPKSIKTFKDARKWLIDNKIIGNDADANTIGYRIPTLAESSIHAIRILDVIDDVKGSVILPKAFTTVTGSDKIYQCSNQYNIKNSFNCWKLHIVWTISSQAL